MEPSSMAIPKTLTATCIECERSRQFSTASAHPDGDWVEYECQDCGYPITLVLNGGTGP